MEEIEIMNLLVSYRYWILVPLLMIQGPVVALVAGFLASKGLFAPTALGILVALADVITDTIIYITAYAGRMTLISRWGAYIGLSADRLSRAEALMKKYGGWGVAMGKVAYGLGTPTMILAGLTRMPYLKFIGICILVAIPKSILLVSLGYFLGANINSAMHYLNYLALAVLAIVIVVGLWIWKKR